MIYIEDYTTEVDSNQPAPPHNVTGLRTAGCILISLNLTVDLSKLNLGRVHYVNSQQGRDSSLSSLHSYTCSYLNDIVERRYLASNGQRIRAGWANHCHDRIAFLQ